MTSVDAGTRQQNRTESTTDPLSARIARGAPFLISAAFLLFAITPIGGLPPRGWVPIVVGLAYIASGLLNGRRGLLLAPGIVVAVWGIAPMSINYGIDFGGMFYLWLGVGLAIAALLAKRGWDRITPMSLAVPVLFIGLVMFVAPFVGQYLTTCVAVPLALWGVYQMRPMVTGVRA